MQSTTHDRSPGDLPVIIATRGSALALAQASTVLAQCRQAFPLLRFELKIIKTTGDKLQTAALAQEGENLPKGLFTKELEVALLKRQADLAVHSLKDLPTELPSGLKLGAVGKRADVRDVLIYRDADYLAARQAAPAPNEGTAGRAERRGFKPKLAIKDLPENATIGTCSTRRKSQLLAHHPQLHIVELRGNVATRLQKLAERPDLDATILAAAGLGRLQIQIGEDGKLTGEGVPAGLLAIVLEPEVMLPCVGQGAIGIETRATDARIDEICAHLNHPSTQHCVTAERAFLAGMGGGCQSPVGAFAEIIGEKIRLRVISFQDQSIRRLEGCRPIPESAALGKQLAQALRP
jgi:hydroxymethylbilane synthase